MTPKRSLEGKIEARRRDRERKRRDQMTPNQLESVRSTEKKYKKCKRSNMSETEKQKARDIRNMKNKIRVKKIRNAEDLKEMKKINEVLRKRKYRLHLSEEGKNQAKLKSKVGMALGRKNGFLSSYKQRQKRDRNELYIWKKFIERVNLYMFREKNPKLKDVNAKLASLNRQIKDFEYNKWEKANRYKMMKTWTFKTFNPKEEICNKRSVRMRQYRTKIKEKINIEELKTKQDKYDSDDMTSDEEDNSD